MSKVYIVSQHDRVDISDELSEKEVDLLKVFSTHEKAIAFVEEKAGDFKTYYKWDKKFLSFSTSQCASYEIDIREVL